MVVVLNSLNADIIRKIGRSVESMADVKILDKEGWMKIRAYPPVFSQKK